MTILVNLSVSSNAGTEAGTTIITVTATASSAVSGDQTVALGVSGTGITASDYYLSKNTITIPNGQTTGSVSFIVADDAIVEGTETATLTISTPSAGISLGATTSQNITITNNDSSFLTKVGGATSVNGAEISAFDPGSKRLFVVAGNTIEFFTVSNTGTLALAGTLTPTITPPVAVGTALIPNSVAVKNGVVAVAYAVQDTTTLAQLIGKVAFFNADNGSFINAVDVGALPDMLTFTPDGTKVLVANEGEPNSYGRTDSVDPEGSVSIINIAGGVANATVQTATFTNFNDQIASLKASGVRIIGPGSTVAQDLEPEYIAVAPDGLTARITLQENNAIAILDIATATITQIIPLGVKDYSLPGNGIDASDQDGGINIKNWPVVGLYQPDAIASFSVNGQTYYITANEGDSRNYPGFNEEIRVGDPLYVLDPTLFPNATTLKQNTNLGRLQLTKATGDTDGDGDIDRIESLGARSFSIWNSNGTQVFDSGDQLEQITATRVPTLFNSDSNGTNIGFDTRSDNKGPEPEGVAVGVINGRTYAFIGLERTGDVIVYDVSNPNQPTFVQYINRPEDLQPEGLTFISAAESPTGKPLLVTSNESSKTVAIFEINPPPVFDFSTANYSVTEGNTSGFATNATVRITRSGSISATDTVQLQLSDGTAKGSAAAPTVDTSKGLSSSATSYIIPTTPGSGVSVKSILTVGDSVNNKPDGITPYRLVGIPDGLGAFDNGDGTFTLLVNHEIGSTNGVTRAHGSAGAFVSKWVINKSDLSVVSGSDLIQSVNLWNGTGFTQGTTAFGRFCSADLASVSAFYNSATGLGTQERIFLTGEEIGAEGRAFGLIATGANAGTTYQLPYLGKFSWENAIASPIASNKTVVAGTDDATPGQVYFYVGDKTNTGTDIDKAGLNNGKLYGVAVPGLTLELATTALVTGTRFTLADLGNVANTTGAALQTQSVAANVTQFGRPEDGAWDPSNPNDFYFATTGATISGAAVPSRLWRLRFDDATNPTSGGTIEAVLNGTEGHSRLDNLAIDKYGHILLQEDLGNTAAIGKIWQYDIATDTLTQIAQHDPARFITGVPNFLTQDEESSGIIDAQDILGPGWFLLNVQAHYGISGELVEGGQLQALFNPDTYKSYQADYINSPITVTFAPGETYKDVQIPIAGDTNVESNETVNLTLVNPSAGSLVGTTQPNAVLTIQNDDIVNTAPLLGTSTTLYNSALNTLPSTQGWSYQSLPNPPGITPIAANGVTNLNTLANSSFYAGFARTDQVLDRTQGYTLSFTAQVLSEARETSANKNNDGKDDRAGFSVILLSGDTTPLGIELGFFSNSIWAQEGGSGANLFTQAESVAFDTSTNPVDYQLTVLGNTYTIRARNTVTNAIATLSGNLRDYTAFVPPLVGAIDPYETPNFMFLGDNTTSAKANVNLGSVALTKGLGSAISIQENTTSVVDLDATDVNGDISTFSITGGADQSLFNVDANSGLLSFKSAPNFEAPSDSDNNNVYLVQVAANDGNGGITTKTINVNVLDVGALSISDVSITEGNSGTSNATFTVSLTSAFASNVTVDYATVNGTAYAGYDFTAINGSLTFAPGETTKTVNVAVIGDVYNETNETFKLQLSNPTNAEVGNSYGTATIIDNDALPTISINNISIVEGNTATRNASLSVKLSSASGQPVTVNYATVNGTATAGSDYTAISGSLAFAPGNTSLTIDIPIVGDTTDNTNEDFVVNLTNANGATLTTNQGTVTILDDDTNPNLTLTGTPGIDNLTGGNGNDSIFGLAGNDNLNGGSGNDSLTGGLGADILTGGLGVDTFIYNNFNESMIAAPDRISDFNSSQGDRIQILSPTNALSYAGILSTVTYNTLSAATTAAYSRAGASVNQTLGLNEAIFFGWNRRTYLSVNDNNAGFNSNSDLLIEVTGIAGALPTGSLNPTNYFAPLP